MHSKTPAFVNKHTRLASRRGVGRIKEVGGGGRKREVSSEREKEGGGDEGGGRVAGLVGRERRIKAHLLLLLLLLLWNNSSAPGFEISDTCAGDSVSSKNLESTLWLCQRWFSPYVFTEPTPKEED